jgi:hypothetical protein
VQGILKTLMAMAQIACKNGEYDPELQEEAQKWANKGTSTQEQPRQADVPPGTEPGMLSHPATGIVTGQAGGWRVYVTCYPPPGYPVASIGPDAAFDGGVCPRGYEPQYRFGRAEWSETPGEQPQKNPEGEPEPYPILPQPGLPEGVPFPGFRPFPGFQPFPALGVVGPWDNSRPSLDNTPAPGLTPHNTRAAESAPATSWSHAARGDDHPSGTTPGMKSGASAEDAVSSTSGAVNGGTAQEEAPTRSEPRTDSSAGDQTDKEE